MKSKSFMRMLSFALVAIMVFSMPALSLTTFADTMSQVYGTVTDTNGNDIADVQVRLSSGETTITDATGAYSFLNLGAGTYTVSTPAGLHTSAVDGIKRWYNEVTSVSASLTGESSSSEEVNLSIPRSIVKNVTATAGDSKIDVSWDAMTPPAQSYNIYLDGTLKDTVAATTHSVTGLTNGQSYQIEITANNAVGDYETAFSNMATATPSAAPTSTLSAPQNVTAVSGDKKITVTWGAVSGANDYIINYNGTTVNAGNATSFTITGLTNGAAYNITVFATDGSSTSAPSAGVSATPSASSKNPIYPGSNDKFSEGSVYIGNLYGDKLTSVTYSNDVNPGFTDRWLIWVIDGNGNKFPLTKIAVKASKLGVQIRATEGSVAVKKAEIVYDKIDNQAGQGDLAWVELTFADEFQSTKAQDFYISLYLTIDKRRNTDSECEIMGTFTNEITSVTENDDHVYLGDDPVAEAEDYIKNIRVDFGQGVSIYTKMFEGKKYYGRVTQEVKAEDEAIIKQYPDIQTIYYINSIGFGANTGVPYGYVAENTPKIGDTKVYYSNFYLSSASYTTASLAKILEFDLDEKLYVYAPNTDGGLTYIGTTDERLPLFTKYYLASKVLENSPKVSVVIEAGEENGASPQTGGSSAKPNVNDNPSF